MSKRDGLADAIGIPSKVPLGTFDATPEIKLPKLPVQNCVTFSPPGFVPGLRRPWTRRSEGRQGIGPMNQWIKGVQVGSTVALQRCVDGFVGWPKNVDGSFNPNPFERKFWSFFFTRNSSQMVDLVASCILHKKCTMCEACKIPSKSLRAFHWNSGHKKDSVWFNTKGRSKPTDLPKVILFQDCCFNPLVESNFQALKLRCHVEICGNTKPIYPGPSFNPIESSKFKLP